MCDIFLYNSNIHQKSNKTKCKTNIVFSRRPSVGPKTTIIININRLDIFTHTQRWANKIKPTCF